MKTAFTFIGIIFLIALGNTQEINWKHKKTKHGIAVYTYLPEGDKLKQLKIVMDIETDMSTLLAAIEDVDAQTEWIYKCKTSKILEQTSEVEFIYYIDSDFPMPASDRDIIVYYKREPADENGVIRTFSKAVPYDYPIPKKFVRITDFESKYILTPLKESKIQIEYYMKVDPGGILPAWLINLAADAGPIKTMKKLKEMIAEGKF